MPLCSLTSSHHNDAGAHRFVAAVGAAFLLNGLLVLGDFLETSWAFLPAQISLELAAFLALALVLPRRRGRSSSAIRWLLAAVILALILLRLADIVVPWSSAISMRRLTCSPEMPPV